MPTDLPRTQVTHTARVQHALDVAGRHWPGQRPGQLLTNLIEAGAGAIEDAERVREDRLRALASTYEVDFAAGYLDEVRSGWPE